MCNNDNYLIINCQGKDFISKDTVLSTPFRFTSAQFNKSGEYLIATTCDSTLWILRDCNSDIGWTVEDSIKENGYLNQCLFYGEKKKYILVVMESFIQIYKYSNRKKRWLPEDQILTVNRINNVEIARNESMMAITYLDGKIDIYKKNWRKKWKYLYSIETQSVISRVYFNVQGSILISSHDNKMIIWEIKNKKYRVIKEIDNYDNEDMENVAFNAEGTYAATISTNGTVRVMKLPEGLYVMEYKGTKDGSIISFNRKGDKIILLNTYFGNYEILYFPSLQNLINETRRNFSNRNLTEVERKAYYLD